MVKRDIPPVDNLIRGMIALEEKSGRELAILGYSWVDAALHLVLSEYFWEKSYTPPTAPIFSQALRSSESRIQVAHALGQITDRFQDQTDLLRKVRNEFAHSIEDLDSESQVIKTLVGQMDMVDEDMMGFYATGETLGTNETLGVPDQEWDYDGVRYNNQNSIAFFDSGMQRVMFFLPRTDGKSADAKLLRQIRLCVGSIVRGGLVKYIGRTKPHGVAELLNPYRPQG